MRPEPAVIAANNFAEKIKAQYATGRANEQSYRSALEELVQNLLPDYLVTNEASISSADRPDLTIWQQQKNLDQAELLKPIPLAYVEHKNIGVDLDRPENQSQLKRYLDLGNVVHTDTLSFRFYINKEKVIEIKLAEINAYGQIIIDSDQYETLSYWFAKIISEPVPTVRTPKALAELMADRAKPIRWTIQSALEKDIGIGKHDTQLYSQFAAFKKELIHDLTPSTFADLYAQTIAYGLFAARYHDKTPKDFSRQEAATSIPATNPFLQKFFREVAGYETEDRITWVLDNFANLFNYCDVHSLMSQYGHATAMNHDPVIHFYETFLGEYDQKLRKSRGVYYTPQPVVNFIVRSVDEVLQTEFDFPKGLADTSKIEVEIDTGQHLTERKNGRLMKTTKTKRPFRRVQVLDPATGTGTFLNEVIKLTYAKHLGQEGAWPNFVENELLPSLHGFELLMAAYAMAHMKLGITLTDTGYEPTGKHRLGVYLTNSLEAGSTGEEVPNLFGMTQALSEEAHGANEVKNDVPVMVVVGNPPYSGVSTNKSDFITDLVGAYKVEPGGKQKLQERKHWLNDDYVKFIRLAEYTIEKNGEGVLGFITNHGYLDNPTFRGMRWHLVKTFSKIYILDLHGNVKKKETTPGGGKDENVFDIEQGVSIIIAFKKPGVNSDIAEVYRADLWGKRQLKYEALSDNSLQDINWQRINLDLKYYSFTYNKDLRLKAEYDAGISVADLFPANVTGIVSMGDGFIFDKDRKKLEQRIHNFFTEDRTEQELRTTNGLGKNYAAWIIANKRKGIQFDPSKFAQVDYRPFDKRWTYFDDKFIWRSRIKIMRHFIAGDNVGLISSRINRQASLGYFFTTDSIADFHILDNAQDSTSVMPLYLYLDDNANLQRQSNLDLNYVKRLLVELREYEWVDDHKLKAQGDTARVSPMDIFDYTYAVLHSQDYRKRYKDFLKSEFPRIPIATSTQQFWKMVALGGKLRQMHLLTYPELDRPITNFSIKGSNAIDQIRFERGNIWINDTQYFSNVPEVGWNFYIGGYQPAQKWLKDRKARVLTNDEIEHYQKIIKVLVETDRIMKEIDEV